MPGSSARRLEPGERRQHLRYLFSCSSVQLWVARWDGSIQTDAIPGTWCQEAAQLYWTTIPGSHMQSCKSTSQTTPELAL